MGAEDGDAAGTNAAEQKPQKKTWPSPKELERWLMMSSKDADPGAAFLRRMLQVNPAYGSYLSSNEDLAELVMSFAKKFRSKIQHCSQPLQPHELYEPLCEVVWRVVGYNFHTIIELQDNQHLPVPQMALGQIKMLLQTNEELSKQLKENRRAYLKEIALLRDRDRRLSAKAQRAIESLAEEPVYFYEPLSYVLDDTTKEFVKEVVEERMKLEMRSTGGGGEKPTDEGRSRELDEMENEVKKLRQENKHLRTQAARNEDKAKRSEEMERRARDEAERQKKMLAAKCEEFDALQGELERVKQELKDANQRIEDLKKDLGRVGKSAGSESSSRQEEINELRAALDEAIARARELEDELARIQKQKQDSESKMQEMSNALKAAGDEVSAARAWQTKEVAKKGDTVTNIVKETDSAELEKLSKQHEEVEKQLHERIRILEEELEQERNKGKKLVSSTKQVVQVKEGQEKTVVKKGKVTEAELDEAVRKVTDKLKVKMEAMQEEIDRLKAELADALERLAEYEKDAKRNNAQDKKDDDELRNAKKWKFKYEELLKEYEALKQKCLDYEDKINTLIQKLRHYGGEEALSRLLDDMGLVPPPGRKVRKKKAWERLYDDAMRRIEEKKKKAEKEREEEEAYLAKLKTLAQRGRMIHLQRQVEALASLQKAKAETEQRYYEAFDGFNERNREVLEGEFVEVLDFGGGVGEVRCGRCGHRMQIGPRSKSPDGTLSGTMSSDPLSPAGGDVDGFSPLQSRRIAGSLTSTSGENTLAGSGVPKKSGEDFRVRALSPSERPVSAGWDRDRGWLPDGGSDEAASPDASSSNLPPPGAAAQQVPLTRTLRKAATSSTKPASMQGGSSASGASPGLAQTWSGPSQDRSPSPGGKGSVARDPMPWRQPDGATGTDMYGAVPTLEGGSLPWKRQAKGGNPPPPPQPGRNYGGYASRGPGPEWVPQVPGRVPSTGILEPIGSRVGTAVGTSSTRDAAQGSRSPRMREARGATSATPPSSADRDKRPRSGLGGVVAAPRALGSKGNLGPDGRPLPSVFMGGAGAGRRADGLAVSRSVPSLPPAGSPSSQGGGRVEPKVDSGLPIGAALMVGADMLGAGFLVKPMVSQQSLAAGVPLPLQVPH